MLVDLRSDERGPVLRAGLAMAAILAAHTIAETARDALFLRALPADRLPLVYALLAVVAIVALRINARFVRRAGRRVALVGTLVASAIGTAAFVIAPLGGAGAFGLYLWTGLLGTIVIVQFWMLVGLVFTAGQGRRLFGPIAAFGAAGALAGACLAGALLVWLRVEQLLLVAAALHLAAARILSGGASEAATPAARSRPDVGGVLARLRDRPYLRRHAALIVLGTAAALFADYLMKAAAAGALDADAMPGFFARYHATVAAITLVLQLFGAAWLIRRVGVVGALALLPLALLAGGVATMALGGALAAAVATRGTETGLRHSVHRVACEIAWMPVADVDRALVRGPLDALATRLSQAAGATLLLVATLAGVATPTMVAAALAALAAGWLVVTATMRRAYLDQLGQALGRSPAAADRDLDLASIEVVVEALSSTDPRRVIAAMEVLAGRGRARLVPALVLLHDEPAVLLAALRLIATPGRRDWLPLARRLVEHPAGEVRAAALRALARAGDRDTLRAHVDDADPLVHAHAAFWLARGRSAVADPRIVALIDARGPEGDRGRLALVEAIREDGDRRWIDVLLALHARGDPALTEQLVPAIERVPDPRFLPALIARLGVRGGRASVRASLVRLGEPALARLEAALVDPATPRRVRLHLPGAIAQFGTARAARFLLAHLPAERSGAVRYHLLRALARLAIHRRIRLDRSRLLVELRRQLDEHFRLLGLSVALDAGGPRAAGDGGELLRGLLRDKQAQALERAFLLLQAAHPREDVRGVERALEGGDRVARAHAVEFLDTLTRGGDYLRPEAAGLRELLLLAADDLPAADRVARAGAAIDPPAGWTDAMSLLVADDDGLLASLAAFHAIEAGAAELEADALLAPLGISAREVARAP